MHLSARRQQAGAFALALILIPIAIWLEFWVARALSFNDAAGARAPLLFFILSPAVLGIALAGGLAPGLLALALAAVGADYFVLGPGAMLQFAHRSEAAALASFIAVSLPVTILAGRVGRRLREQDERRIAAERVAARAGIIEQITAALARAVQPADAIEACVQEAAHWLQAQAGAVLLTTDDRTLVLARAIGHSEAAASWLSGVSLAEGGPMADALARRAPVFVDSREQFFSEYGERPDALAFEEHQAMVAFPLVGTAGPMAVVRLDFRDPRVFTEDDKDILAQLAPRAAQALERTRQHEFAERARDEAELHRQRADQELEERLKIEQALRASENRYRSLAARTSRLHALTAALSESVAVEAVARAVVERGRIVVGATAADVMLLVEEGGSFHTVYSDPRDATGTRTPVENGLCATEALATRSPVFIRTFAEMEERCWRSAAAAADGGYTSSAALPLLVEGSVIGVLSFHFTVPVNFDDEYQALLVSVAQHCAQAMDRARLYESAQQARAEAEQANRLKDDFLSIVSHELRTPLSSILGWASILQRPAIDATLVTRAVQSIRDNATRQAKLVDDLLDFSRIVAGRLTLDRQLVNMTDLLRGVIEAVLPAAAAQRVDIRYEEVQNATVEGDTRRLEQIFLNLLGNAVKFTPADGTVTVAMTADPEFVRLRIKDTGVGIDPEFLPHVFERFRQAEPSASRTHDGVGLGLSIAKQLVEAHGGTISVWSEGVGLGTTFEVTLPVSGRHKEPARSWSFAESERAGV